MWNREEGQRVLAIYKKEIRSFCYSLVGSIFTALLLAVCGIYFTAIHLSGAYPRFSYTLQSMTFVFLIAVPVLTMRSLAEERRQKTDQLLLTAPVSVPEIVLGKYAALVTAFLVPLAIISAYPLILSGFGQVPLAETYVAFFGFFLMGCTFLAAGLWISSGTESQIIAAILTFAFLFFCYVIKGIASFFPETAMSSFLGLIVLVVLAAFAVGNWTGDLFAGLILAATGIGVCAWRYIVTPAAYEGLMHKILYALDMTGRFSSFASGILDLTGVVYYLSITGVFLFLTIQSIRKRRRAKKGTVSAVLAAVVIAAAAGTNFAVSKIPSELTEFDMTAGQLSVLTDQSLEVLKNLRKDYVLYYLVRDQNKDGNVARLLERIEDASPHIRVEEKDPILNPAFSSRYTQDSLSENSLILVSGEDSKVLPYEDLYKSAFNYNTYSYEAVGFDAEGQITSAIAAMERGSKAVLYVLGGHNEIPLSELMQSRIRKDNIEIRELSLVGNETVPEDAAAVLVNSPEKDFTEAETEKLLNYLKRGGHAIILTDETGGVQENLDSVLAYYAIGREKGIVMEKDSSRYIQVPYYLLPEINYSEASARLYEGSTYVLLAAAQGLYINPDTERETLDAEGILSSSESSFARTDVEGMESYEKEEGDVDGPFYLGIAAAETVTLTRELLEETSQIKAEETIADSLAKSTAGLQAETEEAETPETTMIPASETAKPAGEEAENVQTRLAVFGSSSLLNDSADSMVSGGNSALFMDTLNWILGSEKSVSIPVKNMEVPYLTVPSASGSFWSLVTVIVIPSGILLFGVSIWLRRRR